MAKKSDSVTDLREVGGQRRYLGTEEVWDFGWIPPDQRPAEVAARHAEAIGEMMPNMFFVRDLPPEIADAEKAELWKTWEHPDVVAATGGTKFSGFHQLTGSCLPAGVPVRMADGSEQPIESVNVGDEVATHTGHSRRVVRTFAREFTGELVTIQPAGFAFPLTMTADHPVAVLESRCDWRWQPGEISWKQAGDLEQGDRVLIGWSREVKAEKAIDVAAVIGERCMILDDLMEKGEAPVNNIGMAQWVCRASGLDWRGRVKLVRSRHENAVLRHIPLSPSFARLIGLYLAEGGTSEGRVVFTFDRKEEDLVAETLALVRGLFGVEGEIHLSDLRPTSTQVRFTSTSLAAFFKMFVSGNVYSKRVPGVFFVASEEIRLALLLGWMHGDGYAAERSTGRGIIRIQGVTASPGLARDVGVLAMSCGIRTSISRRKARKQSRVAYDVFLSGPKAVSLFPALAGVVATRGKIAGKANTDLTRFGYARPLKRVVKVPVADLPVYDLEIEEDHSFLAQDIVVHNCVGAGGGNTIFSRAAVDVAIKQEAESAFVPWWPLPYGKSRQHAGMRGQGEGSLGSTFAKAVRVDGVIPANMSGLPKMTDSDGLTLTAQVERQWSAGESIDQKWLTPARVHLVQQTAQLRSAAEVREALLAGDPVSMAGDWGGMMQCRTAGNPPVLMNERRGTWNHQQCFAPDTKVSLLDGTEKTVKELADAGLPVWVYSYCLERKRVVPKLAESRMTRRRVPEGMIKVVLDNGESVTTTLDHRFLTREGQWVRADQLKAGQSLMPLYRRDSTKKDCPFRVGYEMLTDPGSGQWTFTHTRVAEEIELAGCRYKDGHMSLELNPGSAFGVVHHADCDKRNNEPSNLVRMLKNEHWKLHSEATTPDNSEGVRKSWEKANDRREAARQQMLKQRQDKEFVEKLSRINSEKFRKANQDPEFCRKRAEGTRKSTAKLKGTPEYTSKKRETFAKTKQSAEFRKKQAAAAAESARRPEVRAKLRDKAKARFTDPVFLEKFRAACRERERKKRAAATNNHKVAAVIFLPHETGPTYCLKVEGTHNFAVTAGVFVHNSVHGFWDHPTQKLIFYWMNQWGQGAHGKCPSGAPSGGYWVSEKDMEYQCRNGEVFRFIGFAGFPGPDRPIPWIFASEGKRTRRSKAKSC